MKKFLQYGAGNIGRGFIGPLFSQGGYEVSFIDIDRNVIDALNQIGRYPVTIVSNELNEDIWVENVKGIDGRSEEEVIKAIEECDVMATAIGVNILPRIVPLLARGVRARYRENIQAPLDIMICENLINADQYLHGLISQQLNEPELNYFNKKIGLVETSIGRMVPVMTAEQKKENILRVCVEAYCELPVDKAAFKGLIPYIPHLYPYTPFEFFIKRKLYVHNMGHALTAYLGALNGHQYIWQAIGDPAIKVIVQRAMQESAVALMTRFKTEPRGLLDHVSHLLVRFSNAALGDTIARVGNDIKRKLSPRDRFAGALILCKEEGIPSFYIPAGIAAALYFSNPQDPATAEIANEIDKNGIEAVLMEFCQISSESENFAVIKTYYEYLKKNRSIDGLLKLAEDFHCNNMSGRKII